MKDEDLNQNRNRSTLEISEDLGATDLSQTEEGGYAMCNHNETGLALSLQHTEDIVWKKRASVY